MLQPALARRTARPIAWRPFAGVAAALGLLVLLAWAVPPLLDGSRYRTAIAAIAAARLGRPVVIAGDISLRLLPQAVLTAADVTLPDQGDGISVQVPALRLQLARLPLAAGRLVVRELVLSGPTLRLPWTMPRGIGRPARPRVPHPFAARIEGGTVQVGRAVVTGITASVHGGPSAPDFNDAPANDAPANDAPAIDAPAGDPPADGAAVAAFGAEGFAEAAGRVWRFTAALGAPDADGVSAVDLSVRGQGAVADTGGSLQGTLADGTMQGRLRASGPDLSLLLPASRLAWTAEAPFVADAARVEAGSVSLSLGGALTEGALVLSLGAPARLEGRLHAVALDLDGWARLLGGLDGEAAASLPLLHVTLSADSASLFGGRLDALRATLVSDGASLGLDRAEAMLPGGARLTMPHARLVPAGSSAAAGLALAGQAHLSAPDLAATLAWLRPLGAVLPGVWRQADLAGTLSLRRGAMTLSGLSGHLDQSAVSGSLDVHAGRVPRLVSEAGRALRSDAQAGQVPRFDVQAGRVPRFDADLAFDRLPLDAWTDAWVGAGPPASLADLARPFALVQAGLHLSAAHATWRGLALEAVSLDARSGPGGLAVTQAAASLAGTRLAASGALAPDGRVTAARLSADSPALERLLGVLPAGWRWLPGLWSGPGALHLTADGPPEALGMQLRADAADLVVEADSVRDTLAGTASTTLTWRHPGAPRLLATIGLPQALGLPAGLETMLRWLDTGSLAMRAHLAEAPDRLSVQDFDLDAASLRVSGQLVADWTRHALTGRLDFDQLALPDALPALSAPLLTAPWSAGLQVTAREVSVGASPVAASLAAELGAGDGLLRASHVSARVAGGQLQADASTDPRASGLAARFSLSGAQIAAPTGWPIDLLSGGVDAAGAVNFAGAGWAGLSGEVHAALRDGRLSGFDLAELSSALAAHTRAGRAAIQASLSHGVSSGLAGTVDATITRGRLDVAPSRLASAAGAVLLTGMVDLAGASVDLGLALSPAAAGLPSHELRLSGAWRAPEVRRPGGGGRR